MEYIKNFLSTILISEGLSKNTSDSYKRDLEQLLIYLNQNNLDILQINTNNLKAYVTHLSTKYSNRTVARHISAIKHFYDFLQTEKIIIHNPSTKLEQKKIEQYLPNFFEENIIERLLNEAKQDTSDYGVKFYCMLELLYASGMRVSELVKLKLSNLDKEFNKNSNQYDIKPYLNIIGKGGKNRIIPISENAIVALDKYLKLREKLLNGQESSWLFTTKVIFSKHSKNNIIKIKNTKKDDFTKRQVFARYLKNIGTKIGIDTTKLSPHSIRHSVATMMLKNGADLRFIQEFLGHSNIETTQIYTHLNNYYKKETIKKYHPFKNKTLDI